MIHFELTFVQVERCAYAVSRTICWRGFLFSPVSILGIFVKNQVAVALQVYFSILLYWAVCLFCATTFVFIIWLFRTFYINKNILCTLCAHFLSLSIIFSIFFHIMSWVSRLFLLHNITLNVNLIFSDTFCLL